ncbi:hypothetical protein DFH09DRAFT_1106287 [Mycena vulgaris]|nr:hypothetical protein DFH09DRAFT_1106287 [Mycena vulgaris]
MTEELIRGDDDAVRKGPAQPCGGMDRFPRFQRYVAIPPSLSNTLYNISETPRLALTQYRFFIRAIAVYITQFTLEAERQRKLAAEIDGAELTLCPSGHLSSIDPGYDPVRVHTSLLSDTIFSSDPRAYTFQVNRYC